MSMRATESAARVATASSDGAAPLRVAIVGAESTGKSELARALADALSGEFGLRCHIVDEWLRDWCDRHGRTPSADEQLEIGRAHV